VPQLVAFFFAGVNLDIAGQSHYEIQNNASRFLR
jgi:hypothetical protein